MAIRPNNEERSFGADRERQREVSSESGRSARTGNADSSERTSGGQDSGSARARSNRGFASMDRGKQREIASKGGRAAHQKGTAHEFDSSEARAAGRKGGVTVSRNREHMAAIGRRGGEARGANRAARMQQQNTSSGSMSSQQSNAPSAPRFSGDREVGLASGTNGAQMANGSAQSAARQSGNSLGGERAGAAPAETNIERP
jgi:general stress protein YciG